tara:strand:- start:699 stop:1397 length:699 start_codon:yes stop_codon:yes gene_type:complete
MPKLPKNLKITFEKSPPPRPEPTAPEPSPQLETIVLEEPDIDALDDMVPQFVEKDPPVESDIFAPAQPRKPPSIRKVVEEPPPLPKKAPKLTKTGKVRKEMSEEQKAKARENLKKARELRASRLKAQAPPETPRPNPEPEPVEAPSPAPAPPPVQAPSPAPAPVQSRGISQADLKQSNLDAIMEYEAIRKKRKAVKKEKQMVEQQRQDVIGVAQKASMNGWAQTSGRFAGCY